MSNYSHTPYGSNYGAQNETNPPYHQSSYSNQYPLTDDGHGHIGQVAPNYDASISAYGYNSNLPAFTAPAVTPGAPLPPYRGWNQDTIPLPPYTSLHNAQQYAGYASDGQSASQYYQTGNYPNYQLPTQPPKPFEQGELSEGEFEDATVSVHTPATGYSANHYRNDGTGYVDMAQRAVYSRTQNYSPQQPNYPVNSYNYHSQDFSQMTRPASDSHSPYVTPEGTDQDDQRRGHPQSKLHTINQAQDAMKGEFKKHYSQVRNAATPLSQSNSHVIWHQTTQLLENNSQNPASIKDGLSDVPSTTNSKSVAESRKKAQRAILNLRQYDVRYQTYIDEGFKEDILGRLFDDLKMPKVVNEPQSVSKDDNASETVQKVASLEDNVFLSTRRHLAVGDSPLNLDGRLDDHDQPSLLGGANERKAITKNSIMQESVPHSNIAGPPSAKSAAMTEKEKTLQSKMEALRKSREERAQKAAAKSNAKFVAAPTVEHHRESPKDVPVTARPGSNSPSKMPSVQPEAKTLGQSLPSRSPVQANNVQPPQAPIIPGLFLVSTATSPVPMASSRSAFNGPTPMPITHRKRPVAADFDELNTTVAPFKRPFGHSRNDRPLVIDVSDDEGESEDEDVAMDLESQADQDSPLQSARKTPDQRSTAIPNLQPLSNFSTRKPFTPPPNSSAMNTPSVISSILSKPALGRPEVLQRKESEIEELKKKIAEAEARKRARQTPSGTRTPKPSETSSVATQDSSQPNINLASKVEASMKMQHMIGVVENRVALDQQRLFETRAIEAEKTAELRENEAEQKRLRREKLATDLPLVEAEAQKNQTRLEQLRIEMAEIEAAVQKNLEDKRRLAEEMERLGQEAEDQLQVQKDKLKGLTSGEPECIDGFSLSLPLDPAEKGRERAPRTVSPGRPIQSNLSQSTDKLVDSANGIVSPPAPVNGNPIPPILSSDDLVSGNDDSVDGPNHLNNDFRDKNLTDHALEAALQEAVRADADAQPRRDDEIETGVSYAPKPSQASPDMSPLPGQNENRSPEYSPTLERAILAPRDRESDDYEPPEATPPFEAVQSPSLRSESTPFSPAPPETAAKPSDDTDENVNSTQAAEDLGQSDVDQRAPPLNGGSSKLIRNPHKQDPSKIPLFVPYESPLKRFRAYRFHPDFRQSVSGGLRSTTYSHKIDSNLEFCRYELAGGVCNDSECDQQHFRDIKLPDDAVLTALGSPDEFSGEQRDKFCEGLREVLMDLRVRKIRDFNIIASEIVAHRAKFLGDKSRVLALEGTSI